MSSRLRPDQFNATAAANNIPLLWEDNNGDEQLQTIEVTVTNNSCSFSKDELIWLALSKAAPRYMPVLFQKDMGMLTIGHQQMLREYQKLVDSNDGTHALTLSIPFEGRKTPIQLRGYGPFHLGNDGAGDYLILLSMQTFADVLPSAGAGEVDFFMKLHENRELTENNLMEAALRSLAENDAGLFDASWITGMPQDTGESRVPIVNSDGPCSTSNTLDAQLIKDVHILETTSHALNYYFASDSYLGIYDSVRRSNAQMVWGAIRGNMALRLSMRPMFRYLNVRFEAISKDAALRSYYEKNHPEFMSKIRAIVKSAASITFFSQADIERSMVISTRARDLLDQQRDSFLWKGKPLPRQDYHGLLENTSDTQERERLFYAYSNNILNGHLQEGGLLGGMVSGYNDIVKKYGYKDVTGISEWILSGVSVRSFEAQMQRFYQLHDAEIKEYIEHLRLLNGGSPVNEWDILYLEKKAVEQEIGSVPQITMRDALVICKRFFKEMGFDFDATPLKNKIHFDTKRRPDKIDNTCVITIADGGYSVLIMSRNDDEFVTLDNIGELLHEMTHALHFALASERSDGDVLLGARGIPDAWREGIARRMQKIVWERSWLDRYAAEIPGFEDPHIREIISRVKSRSQLYHDMEIMARTLWEIELYRQYDTMKEKDDVLRLWPVLSQKYLHTATHRSLQAGSIYTVPHFAISPLYYLSYEGGMPYADRTVEPLIKALRIGTVEAITAGASGLGEILRQGGRCTTLDDIDQFSKTIP